MKLYEISSQYRAIFDSMDASESEIEIDDAFDLMDALGTEFEIKAEAIGVHCKELKAEQEAISHEIDTLRTRMTVLENAEKRLKAYLISQMQAVGTTKVSGLKASVSLRNNPDVAVIEDEKKFVEWASQKRDDLLKFREPEISKTAIKNALKDGQKIPYAHMESGKQSIIIK